MNTKKMIWMLISMFVASSMILAACQSTKKAIIYLASSSKDKNEVVIGKELGTLTLNLGKGKNAPRSVARGKGRDNNTLYMVEEGARDAENGKSSYIYKITFKSDGSIENVVASKFYFENTSPVDIAIRENKEDNKIGDKIVDKKGDNIAYITVERPDKTNIGIYRVNLEEAFKDGKEQKDYLKKYETKVISADTAAHLTGIVLGEKQDYLYVIDFRGEESKIHKIKVDDGGIVFKNEILEKTTFSLTSEKNENWKNVYSIVQDPDNANTFYVATHPVGSLTEVAENNRDIEYKKGKAVCEKKKVECIKPCTNIKCKEKCQTKYVKCEGEAWEAARNSFKNKSDYEKGKILKVKLTGTNVTVEEVIAKGIIGATDLTIVIRGDEKWLFAPEGGYESTQLKGHGRIRIINIKPNDHKEYIIKGIGDGCHSFVIVKSSKLGKEIGFIPQIVNDKINWFPMNNLWEILSKHEGSETVPSQQKTATPIEKPTASEDTADIEIPQTYEEVTIAVENAYPPFNFIDEATGEAVGWDYDAGRAICNVLNCTPVFLETAWEGIFEAAAAGEFDVAFDGITYTEERDEVVDFSIPYLVHGQVVLVRKEETEITDTDALVALTEKVVGVQLGTTNEAVAIEFVGEERAYSFDSFDMPVHALMGGDVDAVVIDDLDAFGFIATNPDRLKIVGERFTSEELAFVFPTGSDLIEPFNYAIEELKEGGILDELYRKWFIEFRPAP